MVYTNSKTSNPFFTDERQHCVWVMSGAEYKVINQFGKIKSK